MARADMGGWFDRFRKNVRSVRQIVRDRSFCLLPYLSSIDDDFYIQNDPGAGNTFERDPHPLFDSIYYRNRYLDNSFKGHPFCHYMSVGFARGHKPGPFFDYDIYEQHTGWRREHGNPLKHYLGQVKSIWPRTGIFFDLDWYLDKTPILHRLNIDPVKHYRLHGASEGKSPTPLFDPQFYLSSIPEDPHAAADPFSHYLIYSILQDKKPCFWFEPAYYRNTYSSDIGDHSPLEHYLRKGLLKGNYPAGRVEKVPSKPRISVVVPVYNADPHLLNYCIRSVQTQQYPHWQLCLADDGSTREGLKEQLDTWAALDSRIKVIHNNKNKGISAASNAAAALADGDFIGFLDNDDELTPDCLYHVAETIARMSADVVYTDEDLIASDGSRLSVFYKPGFNRVLLESHNYITHFVVVARTLFARCKGFRSECDGAQDFDLMLRLSELTNKIVHIPRVLYHWRATKTSTSINHSQKRYAHEAGKKALAAYINNNQREAIVEDTELHYFYRIKKELFVEPTVDVLVWSQNLQKDTEQFKRIREITDYAQCEFVLLTAEAGKERFAAEKQRYDLSNGVYLERNRAFTSRARAFRDAISTSDAVYLVFLDSSVFTADSGWLREMVSQVSCEGVGIACGRLSYSHGDGISYTVPELNSTKPHYYFSFLTSCSRHLNGLHCSQFIHFSPWDICIINRNTYEGLGGFDDETYPSLFAMTDLSLRAAQAGLKTVYTPYAVVVGEQEELHRGETDNKGCLVEKNTFQSRWRDTLDKQDPYYNLNILDEHGIDRDTFRRWYVG